MTNSSTHDVDLGARRARERRILRAAFLISLVLHVLILVLSPVAEIAISAAAGPGREARAAGGAPELVALASAPPDAPTVITIPEQIILPVEPEVFIPIPVPLDEIPLPPVEVVLDEVGVGDSSGTDAQDTGPAGLPDQTGAGAGGDQVAGPPIRIPPSPRGMIMPPSNRNLRGQEVSVWVFVNEQGRVVADSTRLDPPTSDRRFNDQLTRDAAQWVFEPGRERGQPVADWFLYRIGME